jgi:hypothetical protein
MSEANVAERLASNVVTSENVVEWNVNKLGLATEPAQTAAETVEETPVSEPVAEEGQSEPAVTEQETTETEERKPNPKLEKRFSELTKARKAAEEQAAQERAAREALEARLQALEGQQSNKKTNEVNTKPQPDDYADAFRYAEALAEWSANEAVARREQEIKQQAEQAKQQEVMKTWQQKLEAVKAELPDYEDMVASSTVAVSDAVRDAILESDVGPRILYELASDDELGAKIANLSTAQALKMIGKLEAKFEVQAEEPAKSKPVAVKSNAPKPINPIRGTGSQSVYTDGEQIDYQAWKAGRKLGKIR